MQMTAGIVFSRLLVPVLGLLAWFLLYLEARCAYRRQRSVRKNLYQLSCVIGASLIFVTQVNVMDHFAPNDAYGIYFRYFILIECGGGLALLLGTLVREKARSKADGSLLPKY